MLVEKLHDDEVDIALDVVAVLIAEQYPQAAGLPLTEVQPAGTSNVMVRLGDELVVRMPRNADAALSLEREWLYPTLFAAALPVAISVPVFVGTAALGYPFAWSISRWLEGARPTTADGTWPMLAIDIARFITALHAIEPPGDVRLDSYRGEPIDRIEWDVRAAIVACADLVDPATLNAAWDRARQVDDGDGTRVWLHTDLQPGNLIVRDGRLAGVVDWGGLAIGDPAVDLIVAWNLFDPFVREVFRVEMDVPEERWLRGRAWALAIGIIAWPYYAESNPALAAVSKYQIEQVLAELA